MKAVLYHGVRDLRLEDVPLPRPAAGEVVVKVGAALTCGTDFKAFRQGHKLLLRERPSRFGHELAGTVSAVGRGVKGFKEGDRVVAANSAPCLKGCAYCRSGRTQLCDDLNLHNGAYAEYDLIPAHIVKGNLYKLSKAVPFRTAALSEPFACALHAVDVMGVRKGESAVIIGAGTMALLLIAALRAAGARVFVIGRDPVRLAACAKAGAKAHAGEPADHVFEAVGKPETWQKAIALARKGGKVCLFGGCAPDTQVPVDAHRVHYQQLTLQGVFHHTPKHFQRAVELLSAGKVPVDLIVKGSIRLEDVPSFYAENLDNASIPKMEVAP